MTISPEINEQRRTNFAALRWDAAWIDPAIRRMAETAARQAGLTIEAWMERAIRQTCNMPPAAYLAEDEERPAPPPKRDFSALLTGAKQEIRPLRMEPPEDDASAPDPHLFGEPDAEPLPLTQRIDFPPPPRRRQEEIAAAASGRNRSISLAGAIGIAAVLAVVAVVFVRERGLLSGGETVAVDTDSRTQLASTLPPPSDLDNTPLRVSRTVTDRTTSFTTLPAPPLETAASEPAREQSSTTIADVAPKAVTPMAAPAAATPVPSPAQLAETVPPTVADPAPAAPVPPVATAAPEVKRDAKPVQMAALPQGTAQGPIQAEPPRQSVMTQSAPPVPAGIATVTPVAPPVTPAAPKTAASPSTQVAMATTPPPRTTRKSDAASSDDDTKLAASLQPRAKAGDHVAEYRLGILYALGKGVTRDYDRAAALLRSAAESGLPEAQYDYGVLCDKGLGIARDSTEAAKWYGKAAQQGHAPAALNLGYAYAEGLGVSRNLSEAAKWFRRAADSGLINAQFNLAYMYEQGAGVTKSTADAYAWYSIAADKGDQGAQDALQRVEAAMSVRDLTAAKARAKTIKRSMRVH